MNSIDVYLNGTLPCWYIDVHHRCIPDRYSTLQVPLMYSIDVYLNGTVQVPLMYSIYVYLNGTVNCTVPIGPIP